MEKEDFLEEIRSFVFQITWNIYEYKIFDIEDEIEEKIISSIDDFIDNQGDYDNIESLIDNATFLFCLRICNYLKFNNKYNFKEEYKVFHDYKLYIKGFIIYRLQNEYKNLIGFTR